MFKVKELIKLVAFKALISGGKKESFMDTKKKLKVKQAIENHIQVKEVSVLCYGPPCFSKESLYRGL